MPPEKPSDVIRGEGYVSNEALLARAMPNSNKINASSEQMIKTLVDNKPVEMTDEQFELTKALFKHFDDGYGGTRFTFHDDKTCYTIAAFKKRPNEIVLFLIESVSRIPR